ncbi:TPR repeat-containing protein [Paramagnetospirillum caucaseum]|uniref:TPR repeat-containing protein n=1 Tax=Paramagnetospirillum caucaseum TaxID=1244869 RepID=M2ZU30_9PROT|nr:tetratricopeptide repeat protein [Paramagnetospirillum caucaseum]EME70882.1 TPR repeat-containing protein [Paramagnetospirillum caucaseum]
MAGLDVEDERFLARLAERMPGDPEIMARLAALLVRQGALDKALAAARRAVELAPGLAEAHAALGLALARTQKTAEARACLERAVQLDPGLGTAWMHLGEVLALIPDQAKAAVDALRRACGLLPRDPRPLNALAGVLMAHKRYEDAIGAYRSATVLAAEPNPADMLNNMGVALERLERREEAVALIRSASLVRPDAPAIQDNLGNALLGTARAEEAEACHRRALALGAKGAETWSNLGNSLHRQGRLDEADAAYRRAIQINPNGAKFHTNLALNLLLSGRMEEGWHEYEWRWRDHPNLPPYLVDRVWAGEALPPDLPAGGTLLLQAEQGYGDTLQFVRYAPLLKARGVNRVVLACQPELIRLMETVPGLDAVVGEAGPLPAFDKALTLLSLPRLLADLPAPEGIPYLSVPKGVKVRLPGAPAGTLKVGLAWAGRPTHGDDWNRSIPAWMLDPLLDVPGVAFYSLQRGAVAPRLGRPPAERLVDAADLCADFCDTAAMLWDLDLIVSVDTAVVHLAGALGKPVWLLLPPVPDFRWRMEGETSEWYPAFRLFRRKFRSGWETPIARIAEMLRARAAGPASP